MEVNRPNRVARRMDGKSDRLDAENIARAVLGQTSTAIPKSKSGMVEVIRTLRVTRASAVKARTQAFNNLFGVMIGAPSPLRDELVDLTKRTLVNRCLRLRPETDLTLRCAGQLQRLLLAGVKMALRDLARRWKALDAEIKVLYQQIAALVRFGSSRPGRALRGRRRDRRAVPGHCRRQSRTHPPRSCLRQTLRRGPPTRQQRPDHRTTPTIQRRETVKPTARSTS